MSHFHAWVRVGKQEWSSKAERPRFSPKKNAYAPHHILLLHSVPLVYGLDSPRRAMGGI